MLVIRFDFACVFFVLPFFSHFFAILSQAVGYSCLPTAKDEEGFVTLISSKKESEMKSIGEAKIEDAIHRIMGNNAALKVKVDAIRHMPHDKYVVSP